MALAVVDPAGVAEVLRESRDGSPRSAKAIGVPVTSGEPDPAALA